MIQVSATNFRYSNLPTASFGGHKYVVRDAKNYLEKVKVTWNADKAITDSFYKLYQADCPKLLVVPLQKIEKFMNFVTMFPTDFRKKDVQCVVNEAGQIVGSFSAEKIMRSYHIFNLYLDESVQRTKDAPKVLELMIGRIKELAKAKRINIVSCQVYDKAKDLIRLYKKAGFNELNIPEQLRSRFVIEMATAVDKLGFNSVKLQK